MTREIKFRAWHPEFGMTHDDVKVYGDGSLAVGYGHPIGYDAGDGVVLMQYTGLKDGRSQEIYEGDIVEWWDAAVPREADQRKRKTVRWQGNGWNINSNSHIYRVVGHIYETAAQDAAGED